MARTQTQNKARTATAPPAEKPDPDGARPSVTLVKEGRKPYTTSDAAEITNARARGWSIQDESSAEAPASDEGEPKGDA